MPKRLFHAEPPRKRTKVEVSRYADGRKSIWVRGERLLLLEPREARTLADYLNEAARIAESKAEPQDTPS
jgi:hypothetical protein